MTPTLVGRIQTRIFLLLVVGVPWTILVVPFLPRPTDEFGLEAGIGDLYETAFVALTLVGIVGIGWEFAYQALQQYRWEKDWPAILGLVTSLNEFVVVAGLLAALDYTVGAAVTLHFFSLWLVMWVVANGPLRVVLPRWRYRGGRIV